MAPCTANEHETTYGTVNMNMRVLYRRECDFCFWVQRESKRCCARAMYLSTPTPCNGRERERPLDWPLPRDHPVDLYHHQEGRASRRGCSPRIGILAALGLPGRRLADRGRMHAQLEVARLSLGALEAHRVRPRQSRALRRRASAV